MLFVITGDLLRALCVRFFDVVHAEIVQWVCDDLHLIALLEIQISNFQKLIIYWTTSKNKDVANHGFTRTIFNSYCKMPDSFTVSFN